MTKDKNKVLSIKELVKNECIDFALYIRNNWLPEEGKKHTWWNPETNKFLYTDELYLAYLQSKQITNEVKDYKK